MASLMRNALGSAVLAALAAGCSTSPPGAGFTSGPAPTTVGAEEKPAIRDDLHEPQATAGDASLAGSASTSTGGTGTTAGTGGGGGGQVGEHGTRHAPAATPGEPKGTPPTKEASGESGAQGGTKPPGNINVGNPHSPQ